MYATLVFAEILCKALIHEPLPAKSGKQSMRKCLIILLSIPDISEYLGECFLMVDLYKLPVLGKFFLWSVELIDHFRQIIVISLAVYDRI